jgi:hypothetical protein
LQESVHDFPSFRSSSGHPGLHPDSDADVISGPHGTSMTWAKTGPAENWMKRRMATTMRIGGG